MDFFSTEPHPRHILGVLRKEDMGIASEGLKTSFRSHPINDRRRYTGYGNYRTDRKFGTHMEMVESYVHIDMDIPLETLKGEVFTLQYREKAILTPVMYCNKLSKTKERIIHFQAHHKQILDIIKTGYWEGIDILDFVSENIGKTLQQLILLENNRERKRIFVSVDQNLYSSKTNFYSPKIYKEDAHNHILAIGAYLNRLWGGTFLQFFSTHDQAMTKATKWDKKDKYIFVIDPMLAIMEDEKIEAWMIDPTSEYNPTNL